MELDLSDTTAAKTSSSDSEQQEVLSESESGEETLAISQTEAEIAGTKAYAKKPGEKESEMNSLKKETLPESQRETAKEETGASEKITETEKQTQKTERATEKQTQKAETESEKQTQKAETETESEEETK